ncbi:ligand-binding sensor domain-containing protein [Aliikangiella sp. IMCC44632]
MHSLKWLTFLLVIKINTLVAVTLIEPNIRFQHLNLEQGLSQEAVLAIHQDKDGFMWFGTQEGLNRFDGYNFKVFSYDQNDQNSISSDLILALGEDASKNLWVGTDGGGLNRFDANNLEFTRYQHSNKKGAISNNSIRVIFSDSAGRLWIGSDGGLDKYDENTDSFKHYKYDPYNQNSLANNKVRDIVEDSLGYLWIALDGGGLNRFDPLKETFTRFNRNVSTSMQLASDRSRALFIDSNKNLWVGSYDNGVSMLPFGATEFVHFSHNPQNPNSLNNNQVRDILEDPEGFVWIATDMGLSRWNQESQSFYNLRHDPLNRFSLGSNKTTQLYYDNGGVFWVGTYAGLNKWNSATKAFKHLHHVPTQKLSLTDNGVNAIHQSSSGDIWVGTYNGLNQITQDKVNHYHPTNTAEGLSGRKVMSLHADSKDHLWIGTKNNGLNLFDINTKKFTSFKHSAENENSLSANGVTVIKPASNGNLWVGTFKGGLNLFEVDKAIFTHFKKDVKKPESLSSNNILAIEVRKDGLLWLGTWGGGLNLFNPFNQQALVFKSDPLNSYSISSDHVLTLHEDKLGNLWIGTYGGGLNKLSRSDRKNGTYKFTQYNRNSGLPSNAIYGIVEDQDGFLWLSSNRGLSKFDPVSESILNYDSSHGLQGNDFNAGAYFKDDSGSLYFGGSNGLTIFNPKDIQPNSHQPPVVLTKFLKMNSESHENNKLRNLKKIDIRHQDYFVAFEFAGLDYAQPNNNQYRYILEGFDENWINAGNLRRATYTNLPAGSYNFKVMAANNDGVWSEHGIDLAVTVLPAPWKSWWAYIAYAIILVLLIVASAKAYIARNEKAKEYRVELEKNVRIRTEELQFVNSKLQKASVTDQLTGLNNRRYLDDVIDKVIADTDQRFYELDEPNSTNAESKHRLFFLMFDLDGFKPVNDTYGHSAGDRVITDVANILKRTCRRSDTLVRWGGDEFLVIGTANNEEEVVLLAERLRKSISQEPFEIGLKQKLHLSCSIGFSFYPFHKSYPHLLSWEQVQAIADKALYRSKALGRNTWVGISQSEKKPQVSFMNQLSNSLDKVVEDGYVKLVCNTPETTEV